MSARAALYSSGHGERRRPQRDRGSKQGKDSGEQSLARTLWGGLEEGWLLLADRGFYGWPDWYAAADAGADLLWRVKEDIKLPYLELLPDGSYRSVLVKTSVTGSRRDALVEAARRGEDLDPDKARHVRVIEYAASAAWIDPAGSASPKPSASSTGPQARPFLPQRAEQVLAAAKAEITRKRNLNPLRRHRSYPRVVKCWRTSRYDLKRPGHHGTRHDGPPNIRLANPVNQQLTTTVITS